MQNQRNKNLEAFTIIELSVILAVMGLMIIIVLPTLARDQAGSANLVCLRNLSRFASAMSMYASDFQDYLPPNPDDGSTIAGNNWCPGNAGRGGAQEYNSDILKDNKRALLANYLGEDVNVYRCVLDLRTGFYQGTNQALKGMRVPSARTVSLNGAVGTNPYKKGKTAVDAPWLDGMHTHTVNKTWYCYAKTSDFVQPGPGETFTFIEEDTYSINDGHLGCMAPNPQSSYKMIDWPSTLHAMSGPIAFADGHVEMHRWTDSRTKVYKGNVAAAIQMGNSDLDWLAKHTTALIKP